MQIMRDEKIMKDKILVTGCAGFIGMHLSKALLEQNYHVVGVDNLNNYYDVKLKKDRLNILKNYDFFDFIKLDISDKDQLDKLFKKKSIDKVVNLAAQAGVRYSLENPNSYVESNILGFMNILECCRHYNIKGLIYASSSSVYGGNEEIPFSEDHSVDAPISIYAASKKANELMAHAYSHLFGIKSTGLRFFTVYGPWGRPDMAMYIFAEKILKGEPITVFNNGNMNRDFTYIDDIISGIVSSIKNNFDLEIFNLGNSSSEPLLDVVSIIEQRIGKKAIIDFKPMQLGDVKNTFADIKKSIHKLGFAPQTNIEAGINQFLDWYLDYNLK
jgi:UDP-glucuronate 4-epimerase